MPVWFDKSQITLTVQAKWRVLLKRDADKISQEGGGTQELMDASAETDEAFVASGVAIISHVDGVTWPDGQAKSDAVAEYNALIQKRKNEYEKNGFYIVGTKIEVDGERWDTPVHDKFIA